MDYGPGVVDLLTLAVAGIGYALGRSKGFAWQLSGLLTLLGGGACATVLSRPLAPLCGGGLVGRFAAWIAVYALVAICLYVITLRFRHRLKEIEFDELDRRFGGLLGGIKALSVFALVLLVAVPLSPGIGRAVKSSYAGRALRGLVHELRALLPEQIHDGFGPWLDAVDPSLSPSAPPAPAPPAPAPAQASATAQPPPAPAPAPPAPSPPVRASAPATRPTPPPPPPPSPPLIRTSPPAPSDPIASPDPEPIPDPFDTSTDPPDPLAPPR